MPLALWAGGALIAAVKFEIMMRPQLLQKRPWNIILISAGVWYGLVNPAILAVPLMGPRPSPFFSMMIGLLCFVTVFLQVIILSRKPWQCHHCGMDIDHGVLDKTDCPYCGVPYLGQKIAYYDTRIDTLPNIQT